MARPTSTQNHGDLECSIKEIDRAYLDDEAPKFDE
ncbi:hypothetical protein SNOG_10923 [Parastagonospora nodorum SN15]|uniref:Uncharacterized protein n=1 Tax=Phaeosphaeria nodorum (strain SN15 / ATCC MYA-4574 / FGSC 10173) TaxID=321614 RepID=Q0UBE1_PHANO|nr:hypothetical protein SNOG_10923 [Parastagonospora nodorum SN15]EAT81422.1 hypothetical protein SNOG_10923 [Parastagonospora nodorum SN15]